MAAQKIKLHRIDYIQCGTIKGQAVQLLPAKGGKQQQKIVIGDQKGILQIISIRKGEPFVEVKVDLCSPIHCVAILKNGTAAEVIVVATGQRVSGLSLRGKVTFSIETNLVEPIQHLWIDGGKDEFIVANSHVYNHYHDGKEANYYLSTDKINSIAVLPINKVPSLTPLLACQDGTIYSLRDSAVRHRLVIDGTPSAIHLFGNDGGSSGEWVVYGTATGQIGLVRWSRAGPSIQWRLKITSNATSVTSLDFYDIVSNETNESNNKQQLIVGRDDGVVDVYNLKVNEDGATDTPTLIYSQNFGDSIACVKGGVVSAAGFSEVVVTTQRGWVFGLTTCNVSSLIRSEKPVVDGVSAARTDMLNAERKKQLNVLKNEIEQLEKKLFEAQSRPSSSIQIKKANAPPTEILAKMDFLPDERAYYLSIESQMSINFCLVQCDVDLELLDVERNLAILSKVKSKEEGEPFVATFRCQVNTTRLEMKVRCPERKTSDSVRIYIVPQLQSSNRCAILKTFRIACLCRHMRCPSFEWGTDLGVGYGQLMINGLFSLADVHNWVNACLPNVPDKVPDSDDEISFYFRHAQWETLLSCHYRRGNAVFKSDNAAALFKIRAFISDQATMKNIQLDIKADVKQSVTSNLMKRLEPQLRSIVDRQKKVELARAIKEAVTDQAARQPDDDQWMSDEFKDIIQSFGDSNEANNLLNELYEFIQDLDGSHRNFINENPMPPAEAMKSQKTIDELIENLLRID